MKSRQVLVLLALGSFLSCALVGLFYSPHVHAENRGHRLWNDEDVAPSRRRTLTGNPHLLCTSVVYHERTNTVCRVSAEGESLVWRRGLPQAIIIGVKKGGTRALISMLGLHPQIRIASKEVHFFDRDEEFRKGIDYYVSQMPKRRRNEVVVEKTPSYMFGPSVPERMRENLPLTTKFIAVFREPVARAVSDYMQTLSTHQNNSASIQSFEKKVVSSTGCGRDQHRCVNSDAYLVQVGQYARWLEKWLTYYNRSQFLFLSGEELIKNPVRILQETERFLGVGRFFEDSLFYFNEDKGFYCYRVTSRKGNSFGGDGCLGQTKGRRHVQVDPTVDQMLKDYYRPWNRKLYRLVGRDFHWDYNEDT